jgi:hypothetical protein
MSPEQVQRAASVTASSDQFSLGVVLYQCLTGSRPYPGNRFEEILYQMLADNPTPARHHMPKLPEFVEQVLHRMVRRDPDARFADMGEVAKAFMRYVSPTVRSDFADEFSVTRPSFREENASDPPEFAYAMRCLDEAVPSLGSLDILDAAWNRIAKEPPTVTPYVSSWEPRRWWPLWLLLALVSVAVVAAAATVRAPAPLVRRGAPPTPPQHVVVRQQTQRAQTPLQPAAPLDVLRPDASEERDVARDSETPRVIPQVFVDASANADRPRDDVRRTSRRRTPISHLDDFF